MLKVFRRCILIVIDSFGIGALPDASLYGDEGSNTALHICRAVPDPKWPTLQTLGLGNCATILGKTLPGCEPSKDPLASFGVLAEKSPGKDTTTGSLGSWQESFWNDLFTPSLLTIPLFLWISYRLLSKRPDERF